MGCCNTQTSENSCTTDKTEGGCCGGGAQSGILTEAQLEQVLGQLQGWHFDADEDYLMAVIRFPDFGRAWSFMSLIALAAERLDHHPSWHNVYNRLTIHLTTHDVGGVTSLDVTLAHYIHQQLKNYQGVYEPV